MGTANTKANVTTFRMRTDLHLTRKMWHMGTGVLGLSIYYQTGASAFNTAALLLTIALIGFGMDFFRLRSDSFNELFCKIAKPFMRESERNNYSGLPFYAFGVSLSLFLFPEKLAVLSILFLVFADPISSLFGILLGKDKILPNKSLQGCMAGFFTCYLLALVYGLAFTSPKFDLIIFAFVGGVIGMISELLSAFNIDDNLTVPVFSGFGLTLLNLMIPIF